jgi:peptide/nickel transport system substrate-binding protein
MNFINGIKLGLLSAALAVSGTVAAQTFRFASQGDPQTMDPYSQNEIFTNSVNGKPSARLRPARHA